LTGFPRRPTITCFTPGLTRRKRTVMAVPKRRVSHARQGKRRSHHPVKALGVQYCPRCNEPILPHRVCPNCGHYQGREIVQMTDEAEGK
jgi:large subunit ribosomal protein L32